jgi:hypothetical protein
VDALVTGGEHLGVAGRTFQIDEPPTGNGKPVSWLTYSMPLGPRATPVGTACIGICVPAGNPRKGGASTIVAWRTATVRV